MVLAAGSELSDDVRRAPDDVLSVTQARRKVRIAQNVELMLMEIMHLDPSNKVHSNPIEPE